MASQDLAVLASLALIILIGALSAIVTSVVLELGRAVLDPVRRHALLHRSLGNNLRRLFQ